MSLMLLLSDARVEKAAVPDLDGFTAQGVLWQAAPSRFLLDVPGVARYLVTDGRRICVDPSPKAHDADVARFLRMAPLAALQLQRGLLALHAAAASTPKGAVIIVGDSGAGKSTVLAAMLQRGWTVLADDLTIVGTDEHSVPTVYPTFAEVVLWPDAALKLQISGLETNDSGCRLVFTPPSQPTPEAAPLRAIYRLSIDSRDDVEVSELEGSERLRVLAELSYNSQIANVLMDRARHFRLAALICQSVPMYRLSRPRGRWTAQEIAGILESDHS